MRPGELTMEVPDLEEMVVEEQDEEMRAYCNSEVACGAYDYGRRANQGGETEIDRYTVGNDRSWIDGRRSSAICEIMA
eukprot:4648133-Heterocapsa_arctica.AAC.1